jgi:hypothetical protein
VGADGEGDERTSTLEDSEIDADGANARRIEEPEPDAALKVAYAHRGSRVEHLSGANASHGAELGHRPDAEGDRGRESLTPPQLVDLASGDEVGSTQTEELVGRNLAVREGDEGVRLECGAAADGPRELESARRPPVVVVGAEAGECLIELHRRELAGGWQVGVVPVVDGQGAEDRADGVGPRLER